MKIFKHPHTQDMALLHMGLLSIMKWEPGDTGHALIIKLLTKTREKLTKQFTENPALSALATKIDSKSEHPLA